MCLDNQAEWKDIYHGPLLWTEICLNTEREKLWMTLASRKLVDLSCLEIFTWDVPSVQKTLPGWPQILAQLLCLPFRPQCWCHLLRDLPGLTIQSGPVTFFPLHWIFFITVTHTTSLDCLLVFMQLLFLSSPPLFWTVHCYWAVLSNTVTASHTWLLTFWNVASPNYDGPLGTWYTLHFKDLVQKQKSKNFQ